MNKHHLILLLILLFHLIISINSTSLMKLEEDDETPKNTTTPKPIFSLESGFYSLDEISQLSIEANSSTIYYTLDSTDPTISETSKIYTKPLKMSDRSSRPNVYSKYQHEENSPYSITLKQKFTANTALFDKITIVRAVAQNDNGEFSEVVTKSYFFMDKEKLDFYKEIPTISLVTSPENLFDKEKGIYVCGEQYLNWKNSINYDPKKSEWDTDNAANFFSKGKEWEREASITYFNNKGKLQFEQKMGIRIKGASTRNQKNKGFNIYARKQYGQSKLKYELLENNKNYLNGNIINKYDSFALRSIEWVHRLREIVIQSSLKDIPSLATYNAKKCLLFLDGEFWGLYEIMERCSGYYIQSNFGVPEDNLYIYKNWVAEEGDKKTVEGELWQLNEYCKKNNLTLSKNYEYISSKIDVDSIIYHYAIGLYIGTWDWPNYNFLMWRNTGEKMEGNPYSDGKWRFGSFDFDFSAGVTFDDFGGVEGYQYDFFEKLNSKEDQYMPTGFFLAMLNNNKFKNRFREILKELADDVFEGNKMKKIIDDMEKKYMKYMILNEWRWKNNNPDDTFEGFSSWEGPYLTSELDIMRKFFEKRKEYAIEQMEKFLENF